MARSETEQVSVEEAHAAVESGEDVTVLDVREREEWDAGHIKGARLIPRDLLEYRTAEEPPDRDARIVVHCASGGRGATAVKTLKEMGYTNVANMDGGINAWWEKGYETE